MRIDRIAAGDIVKAQIKGRTVYGEVSEIEDRIVYFRPITAGAGWRHASAREIVGHWRKTGRSRGAGAEGDEDLVEAVRPPREQLSLPGVHT